MTPEQNTEPPIDTENSTCLNIGGPPETYDELRAALKKVGKNETFGPIINLEKVVKTISDNKQSK